MKVRSGGPVRFADGGLMQVAGASRMHDLRPSPDRRLGNAWTSDNGDIGGQGANVRRLRREYAHQVGRTPELRSAANKLYDRAVRNAQSIRDSGDLANRFFMEREDSVEGVPVDFIIYNDDPGAAAIEWGHRARGRGKKGKAVPRAARTRVPGTFFMANAVWGKLARRNTNARARYAAWRKKTTRKRRKRA